MPAHAQRRGKRIWRAALAASAAFLLLATGTILWLQLHSAPMYATGVGEQRSFRLADGSIVDLNSRSRVRIRFSKTARMVELVEGQALFHVAKNHERPFIVRTGATRVRAVGTKFDVYKKRDGTVVTVVEGQVAVERETPARPLHGAAPSDVHPADAAPDAGGEAGGRHADAVGPMSVLLSAGEQLIATEELSEPVRVDASAATAWTQRRLVLDSLPLSEVAEEFNRYSRRRLVVEDSGASALRLSGVFSTDPDFLIRYLRERPDITIHETADEIRIVRHD